MRGWAVLRARLAGCGRDRDRGSATAEAIIIVPVAVLLTLLVVQFVLIWHGRHVAQQAAQSAARAAAAYQGSAGAGQDTGAGYLTAVAPSLLPGRSVQVTRDADEATAVVHAQVLAVIPFASFTVDERASAPVEAWTGTP
jgi:Flp pilus assembly protein TadG